MESLPKEFIEVYECAVLSSLWKQKVITEEQYEWCLNELRSQPSNTYSYREVRENEGCSIL